MLDAICTLIQSDAIKIRLAAVLEGDDSSFNMETFNTDEFSGVVKFQSLLSTVYLWREKPIMITKYSKNEGENTKVYCWMSNQED
tara:strand:+ start:1404 stop:1658 length:255 start_codon:yes stop_codon:yes gene_type:complete